MEYCQRSLENVLLVFAKLPNNDGSQFCYCKVEVVGEMYPCSRAECLLKYFHLECLNLTRALKKSWVCPVCRNVKHNITESEEEGICFVMDTPVHYVASPA